MKSERERSPVRRGSVEVAGGSILAMLGGMKYLEMRARRILEQSGIQELRLDGWYPLGNLLTALDTVLHKIGPNTLKEIGKALPRSATFPTDIDSMAQALHAIDAAYRMNHRGTGDIGGYHVVAVEPATARMVCDTPYPCDLDVGLIEAVADQFRPRGSLWVGVTHHGPECRKQGERACTYVIAW